MCIHIGDKYINLHNVITANISFSQDLKNLSFSILMQLIFYYISIIQRRSDFEFARRGQKIEDKKHLKHLQIGNFCSFNR